MIVRSRPPACSPQTRYYPRYGDDHISEAEALALAETHAKELGYETVMAPEFAADMEEIIRNRKPAD